MGKKVCPICDQVMHSSRYCRICKKWVTPYEREVNYYLNERHPRNESDCAYHDTGSKDKAYQSSPSMAKPAYQDETQVREPVNKPDSGKQVRPVIQNAAEKRGSTVSQPEKQSNPLSGLKWVLFILVFFNFILPVIGILFSFVSTFMRQSQHGRKQYLIDIFNSLCYNPFT